MTKTGERVPRIKKQAIYEMNVVKSCRDNYLEKLEEVQRKIDETEVQLKLLMERGKLSTDISEKKSIAREIKKIRDNLEIMKDDIGCFQDNVDMFDELLTLLDSFFLHERFKYIVKKIPEKKLPIMVKDPDRREEVNDLLLSLLEDFNTAWQKYLHGMKKRKEKRAHIQSVKEEFRERNDTQDSELDAIMAEFETSDENESASITTKKTNKNT